MADYCFHIFFSSGPGDAGNKISIEGFRLPAQNIFFAGIVLCQSHFCTLFVAVPAAHGAGEIPTADFQIQRGIKKFPAGWYRAFVDTSPLCGGTRRQQLHQTDFAFAADCVGIEFAFPPDESAHEGGGQGVFGGCGIDRGIKSGGVDKDFPGIFTAMDQQR